MKEYRQLIILFLSLSLHAAIAMAITPAVTAAEVVAFDAPQQRARYQTLLSELRCLVCQNQTLADSPATLAADMRRAVEKMIKQGEDDRAIIKFMTARYGDYVLYRPPFKKITLFLWLAPFLIVGGGALLMAAAAKIKPRPLPPSEQARAKKLLGD